MQALDDNCPLGEWWALATVDITNAFISVERQAVLEGVARFAPHFRQTLPRGPVDVIPVFCSVLGDVGEPLSVWKGGGHRKALQGWVNSRCATALSASPEFR